MNCCVMAGKQVGIIGILTILSKKINILAVVSYDNIVTTFSEEFNIPTFKTLHNKKFIEYLDKSDLLISIHGREIVPKKILNNHHLKCINVHPCLYKYKGANPIGRLIEDKEDRASVGVHYMSEDVDSGNVIVEEFIDVSGLKTVFEVYNTLYPLYSISLHKALNNLDKELFK